MYKKALSIILALYFAWPAAYIAFADETPIAAVQQAEGENAVSAPETEASDALPFVRFMDQLGEADKPVAEAVFLDGGEVSLVEGETVRFTAQVPQAGLYGLSLTYRVPAGGGADPAISVSVNGEIPFSEADSIGLFRKWEDADRGARNSSGDELIPQQQEIDDYQSILVTDNAGYYGKQLFFPLKEGENEVTVTLQRGELVLSRLSFLNEETPPSYEEASSSLEGAPYTGEPLYFEAENSSCKSASTIYPIVDSTSPAVSPYDVYHENLNTIGGSSWSSPGQYIEWEFEVPQDGLYQIALKARQNVNIGLASYRKITIDGKVPYAELEQMSFPYSIQYDNYVLGGETPFLFYLSRGSHTLRLEVSSGEYSQILTDANEALTQLNTAYRKIIMLTGTSPDSYRNYEIERNLPDVLETFREMKELLDGIDAFFAQEMQSASNATKAVSTLSRQLGEFLEDPYQITSRLSQFKSNITALSSWLMTAKSQPLQIDYFVVSGENAQLKRPTAHFWEQIKHEVLVFLHTFSEDYNTVSEGAGDRDTITVWMSEGQVAMNVIDELVENDFAPSHDFDVDLKLVTASLLTAMVSGKSPDVALNIASDDVMNYAFRDALIDLSQYPDLEEVLSRFRPSALVPLSYEGSVYGLPDTQSYYMMFYRTDVLEELGIKVPENWDEVVTAMAALKKNNLELGIPTDLQSYYMLLLQNGGSLYNDDLTATALDSYDAISAFDTWCGYYTDYTLPISYDAVNRFRTGEMPLMIAIYSTYNQLTITAPEIQGQWGMTVVPATVKEDGCVDRSVSGTVTADIILKNDRADECYEFLKWWTSDDIQLRNAQRKEMVLGMSARSTTASVYAFENLAWENADLEKLEEQAEWVKGIPNTPGSYYVSRHLSNALNRVLYSSGVPSEELSDFAQIIDKEIAKKRKELKLD